MRESREVHLAVNEEKSSRVMLKTVSLDRISFNAMFAILWIPSYSAHQLERFFHDKSPPSSPKSTSNEENKTRVRPPAIPGRYRHPRFEGAKKSLHSHKHRRRVTSTYKHVSRSYCRRLSFYVFHAPEISSTTSRPPAGAASVWYFLGRI